MAVGVVTGLIQEAACFDNLDPGARVVVRCSGADSIRAAECAMALIADGCEGLVSFGLAGGLSPDLGPGALIVPETVVDSSGLRMPTDAGWRARLSATLSGRYSVIEGDIVGVNEALTTASAKAELGSGSGAVAADMESHRVGALAAWTGIPFVAIRVVSDAAGRRVPPWVMAGVRADGSVAAAAMIGGAATHPWDIPDLIGLAGDSAKALATLRGVVRLLGPRLCLL